MRLILKVSAGIFLFATLLIVILKFFNEALIIPFESLVLIYLVCITAILLDKEE